MSVAFSKQDYDGDEYIFGTCYAQDNFSLMWIPIEKNASKIIRSALVPNGFNEYNFHELKKYHVPTVVILRDPIERWISGLVEYLLSVYLDTKQSLNNVTRHNITPDIVFEQIAFDAHTFPQSWFLKDLGPQCDFIWFDEKEKSQLIPTISKYFSQKGIANSWQSKDYPYVVDKDIVQKQQLTQQYTDLLQNNSALLQKVENFYAEDYELINSIKFYT
jgi:hypothetical protein